MRASSGPGEKKFFSGSPRRAERLKIFLALNRKDRCLVGEYLELGVKGLICTQLTNNDTTEKDTNMQYSRRPCPFSGRRTPVICRGFPVGTVRVCVRAPARACIYIYIYICDFFYK